MGFFTRLLGAIDEAAYMTDAAISKVVDALDSFGESLMQDITGTDAKSRQYARERKKRQRAGLDARRYPAARRAAPAPMNVPSHSANTDLTHVLDPLWSLNAVTTLTAWRLGQSVLGVDGKMAALAIEAKLEEALSRHSLIREFSAFRKGKPADSSQSTTEFDCSWSDLQKMSVLDLLDAVYHDFLVHTSSAEQSALTTELTMAPRHTITADDTTSLLEQITSFSDEHTGDLVVGADAIQDLLNIDVSHAKLKIDRDASLMYPDWCNTGCTFDGVRILGSFALLPRMKSVGGRDLSLIPKPEQAFESCTGDLSVTFNPSGNAVFTLTHYTKVKLHKSTMLVCGSVKETK